jgi:hypothetical protein
MECLTFQLRREVIFRLRRATIPLIQSPTLPRSTLTTGISILFLEKVVSGGPLMGPLRLARAHTTIEARLLMESTFPPRRYSSIRSAR